MHIELVDSLRCINDHEETWLVAGVDRFSGRYIAQGRLGCPICNREYPVRNFVAWFIDDSAPNDEGDPRDTGTTAPDSTTGVAGGQSAGFAADESLRLAALLDLRSAGGFVGLVGDRAALAAPLAASYDVQCVAINPPRGVEPGDGVSIVMIGEGERVPFAAASLRAIAFDATRVPVAALAQAILPSGRVVAPAAVDVPTGVRELARDARDWVGEREPDPGPVISLRRA